MHVMQHVSAFIKATIRQYKDNIVILADGI
jgi:hypothetical protein